MVSAFCQTSAGSIHYLAEGKGKTIIFITGLAVTSKSIAPIGSILATKYQTIIPDLFKGRSKVHRKPENISDYAELLHEVVTILGIKEFYLAAWSIGGLIVSSYIQKYPAKVKGIILLSTSTHHHTFMENPRIITKGYLGIFFHNIIKPHGIRILGIFIPDIITYLLGRPLLFFNEFRIGMYDKSITKPTAIPTPGLLIAAQNEEFVDIKNIKKTHEGIKNLTIDIVPGGHDWFFHKPEILLKKIKKFIDTRPIKQMT